jgi:hypothetical protein
MRNIFYLKNISLKLVLFFFITFFILIQNIKAQSAEPTLTETLDWIKTKINTYGSSGYNLFTNFFDENINIDNSYFLKDIAKSKQEDGDGYCSYTKSIALGDVTRFNIWEEKVTLYTSDKKANETTKCDGFSSSSKDITNITFTVNFNDEDNLKTRFDKALKRLVYLNNKDKRKEAF